IVFTFLPQEQPQQGQPIRPWNLPITVTGTTDATGRLTLQVILWTVTYDLQATGSITGQLALQQIAVNQSALNQVPVAVCQAITSRPETLGAPTPFVPRPIGTPTPIVRLAPPPAAPPPPTPPTAAPTAAGG